MKIDQRVLKDALARIRASVAEQRAAAGGAERLALLRLQDALDRLLYMLAGDAPIAKRRAWRGQNSAVPTGALLDSASLELASALADASEYIDSSLRASLEQLAVDLSVLVARVLDATRGASSTDAHGGVGSRGTQPPVSGAGAAAAQPPGTTTLAPEPPGEPPKPERVSFCASAPAQARPGDEFVARFAAYLPEDETEVRTALARTAPGARLTTSPRQGGLLRGTEVEIVLEGAELVVDGNPGRAAQRFTWEGRPHIVEFDVQVSSDATPRQLVLKFYVRLAGVVLERVLLELEIGTGREAKASPRRETPATRLPSTAFASYSSADRLRVLDRVAAIRIAAGIDVFLDCMDLNPSEEWEPRLRDAIDSRDLFILFWSQSAAESRWVTWEWERALEDKGADAMQIQPLENGVRPPRALRHVHVADRYMDARAAEEQRRSRVRDEPPDRTPPSLRT